MRSVVLFFIFSGVIAWGYETPEKIKNKYQALYLLQPVIQADGSVKLGEAQLFHRGGINVLSLKGDSFEMAFQHGKLLKQQVREGSLPQIAQSIENSLRNIIPNIPVVTNAVVNYFYKHYTEAIVEYSIENSGLSRDEALLEAYGLSEGSELPLDVVIRGAYGPESLQTILGEMMKGKTKFPVRGAVNECTDFVARGALTSKGEMIIGRNTDYPLNGFFEKYTTVIYYHPTDGAQKYMAVTSAGVHTAGVIGFNESGLFLGVHTIPTTEVSTKGNSVFIVGQEVLRRAKTFDEAIAYFRKYPSAAGWTYTLASVNENRVAAIELSNKNLAVRESKVDWHAQSNHYLTPLMSPKNLDLNASVNEDSRARLMRAEELMRQSTGNFGAQEAVNVLSDKWDPINQEVRGLGNVIAVHTTLSSAVFDPARGRVFVATTGAPISLGTYIELPTIQLFDRERGLSGQFEKLENRSFYENYPLVAKAEQKFIDAKTAFENEFDAKKANEILKEAVTLDPTNPGYSFVRGIMALKAGDFEDAETAFQHCTNQKYVHYQLVGKYYLGRIWAHRGQKEAAREVFEEILNLADPSVEAPLIKAVKNSLKKVSGVGVLKINPAGLFIFMPEADMVKY